ncbi:MAG: hypothetical protein KatS3mg005_2040 [Bryobacteraceae bacterium]|nr:MAG: hypothetical protein KatS3mg005_2040 [Bryobacteraceae bacterium]
MASLGDLLVKVGLDTTEFSSKVTQVGNDLAGLDAQANTAATGWNAFGGALTSVGATLTAAVTAPLAGLGTAAVTSAAHLEQMNVAMTNLLGSGPQAQALIAQLQQLAAQTPFQFDQLMQGTQLLLAYGFQAEQIIPTLQAVGDAAAGVGAGGEGIERIIRAIGQMQAKGAVAAQEMQQLAELGIPSWQILAEAIGVTVPEAMKLVEQRAVSSAEAIPALLAGLNEKFGGMMETQSQTLLGKWSTLRDNIKLALTEVGEALAPFAEKAIDFGMKLAGAIKDAADWFGKLPKPVQDFAIGLGLLLAAAGPVLLALGGMVTAVGSIVAAWPVLTAGFSALAAMSGPALAIAGITAALAALGLWVGSNWDRIVAVIKQAWDGITEIWGAVWGWVRDTFLVPLWEGLKTTAETVWGAIKGIVGPVWDGIQTAWATVWNWAKDTLLVPVWTAIQTAAGAVWDVIGPAICGIWNGLQTAWDAIWNGVKTALESVWNGIKSAAETIWNGVTGALNGFINAVKGIPGVSKLLNLDEAWNSAKKLGDEAGKTRDEVQKLGNESKSAGEKIKVHASSTKAMAKEARDAEKEAQKLKDQMIKQRDEALKSDTTFQALVKSLKDVGDRYKAAKEFVVEYKARMMEGKDTTWAMEEACRTFDETLKNVNTTLEASGKKMNDISKVEIPGIISAVPQMTQAAKDIENAWKTLGLPSPSEIDAKKKSLQDAYDAIKNSGIYEAGEVEKAFRRMTDEINKMPGEIGSAWKTLGLPSPDERAAKIKELQDAYETIKNSGTASADDIKLAYEKMKAGIEDAVGAKGKQGSMVETVSTAITNFTQDMAKALWDGDLSFGEKAKKMLTDLGKAITASLLEPWTKAITSWITDVLAGKLQPALSGLFNFGGGAASGAAGGAAGAAGGAAGAGAAGAAGAGAAGAIGLGVSLAGGALAGGLAMIGSIIGAKMLSGDMGKVEENTRYTALGILGEQGVIHLLWSNLDHWWHNRGVWADIKSTLGWIWEKVDPGFTEMLSKLQSIVDKTTDVWDEIRFLRAEFKPPVTVTVQGNVIGNDDFIDTLTDAIGKKLALAGGA